MSENPNAFNQPVPVVIRQPTRQPLWLPAGTVRTSLILLIMVPFWGLLLAPVRLVPMPFYLYILLGLVGWFTVDPPGVHHLPFWMPKRLLAWVLFLITLALVGLRLYLDWPNLDWVRDRLAPNGQDAWQVPWLVGTVALGLGAGRTFARLLGQGRDHAAFQDIQAAVCLLAMIGLAATACFQLFIKPQLPEPLESFPVDCVLTGIVAWYFGSRSLPTEVESEDDEEE